MHNSIKLDDYAEIFTIWYLQVLQKQMGKIASVHITPLVYNINMLRGNKNDIMLTRKDQNVLAILHILKEEK